ncbi:MAG TPA: glycosyltransferase [Solirubrobacterales bacterium]|nr:glycosyltransferase [Solirubrobacterales bacterium]
MPQDDATTRFVIAAARNEADRIGATLDALAAALPGARLYVADDASEDGTAGAAMQHGATVIRRGRSHGKGGNVGAAAEAALSELGDADATFLLCDADLGSSAAELVPLLDAVERDECDLAVAAFARREGGGFGFALGYARDKIEQLCGFRAEAPISGQRAMPASLLRQVLPFADGFGMEIGMTVDAVRAGARVKEIELPLTHRATYRTLRGFLHRARQLRDFRRAVRPRR